METLISSSDLTARENTLLFTHTSSTKEKNKPVLAVTQDLLTILHACKITAALNADYKLQRIPHRY